MPLSNNLLNSLGNVTPSSSEFRSGDMPFPMERQRMTKWCWAAATVAICNFYNNNNSLTQGRFVSQVLAQPACNSSMPNGFLCNKSHDFGDAISFARHLHGDPLDRALDTTQVINTLREFGPIGCQMSIPDYGTHAVIITEASMDNTGNLFVRIGDPFDGSLRIMTYNEFRFNYRRVGGRWMRTYITAEN